MPILFTVTDPKAWVDAWESYRSVLRAQSTGKKAELEFLDRWNNEELPGEILSRQPPHITQAELSRLMKWKLMKGKWRPRLQSYVDSLTDDLVISASAKAFKKMSAGDFAGAMTTLCALKGVGPATASAILAAYDPSVPFMSDEALTEVVGVCTYTLGEAMQLRDALNGICVRLNGSTRFSDGSSWTPQRAQLALWAAVSGAALKPKYMLPPPVVPVSPPSHGYHHHLHHAAPPSPPSREAVAQKAVAGTKRPLDRSAFAEEEISHFPSKMARTDTSSSASRSTNGAHMSPS